MTVPVMRPDAPARQRFEIARRLMLSALIEFADDYPREAHTEAEATVSAMCQILQMRDEA